jgi:hypothetical protein
MKNVTEMKRILFFALSLLSYFILAAQPCFPDGLPLTSQEEVNQFPIDNPGCTIIGGDLLLTSSQIVNLTPLNQIEEVQGNFTLYINSPLEDFTGLEKLEKIGGTFRVESTNILNFQGLENLESIGGSFETLLNYGYTMNFDGLNSLTSISENLSIGGDWSGTGNRYLTDLLGLSQLNKVGGNIQIYGSELLSDLKGLENIDSVFGSLTIGDDYNGIPILSLESLEGINNLVFVGKSFTISGNDLIENLEPLSKLKYVGEALELYSNENLVSISGLNQMNHVSEFVLSHSPRLKSLEGLEWMDTITSDLQISYLDSLESIAPLSSLKYVGEDMELSDLWTLKNYDGLENLEYVGDDLSLEYNYEVEDYDGFESLWAVGEALELYRGYKVKDLSGFKNLEYIGEDLEIGRMHGLKDLSGMDKLSHIGDLYFYNNDSLISLNGLEEVTVDTAWVYMYIDDNPLLEDIHGISHFDANAINYFRLDNNPSLSLCAIENICTLIDIDQEKLDISENGDGCNSIEEVEIACAIIGVEELSESRILIYPNPTSEYIQIEGLENRQDIHIQMFDGYGRLIFNASNIQSGIDMSHFLPGIYSMNIFEGKDRLYSCIIQKISY